VRAEEVYGSDARGDGQGSKAFFYIFLPLLPSYRLHGARRAKTTAPQQLLKEYRGNIMSAEKEWLHHVCEYQSSDAKAKVHHGTEFQHCSLGGSSTHSLNPALVFRLDQSRL
jgi:hypothetical protein